MGPTGRGCAAIKSQPGPTTHPHDTHPPAHPQVAYADAAAAQEAVDLLDSYPVGQSLLEVQVRVLEAAKVEGGGVGGWVGGGRQMFGERQPMGRPQMGEDKGWVPL